MIKSFKKINISDEATSKFQNNVEQVLTPVLDCPLLNGNLLQNVVLESSKVNKIPHKLGREYRGFIITGQRSSAIIWDIRTNNDLKNLTIDLSCSANVTVDIWAF